MLVYGPITAELVAMSPHPLAECTVLDAGAGNRSGQLRAGCPARSSITMDLSTGDCREGCCKADVTATRPGPFLLQPR